MRAVYIYITPLYLYIVHALSFAVTYLHVSHKTLIFHDFWGLTIKFYDFPGMENEILKLHDFPGFPWPVQPLYKYYYDLLFSKIKHDFLFLSNRPSISLVLWLRKLFHLKWYV